MGAPRHAHNRARQDARRAHLAARHPLAQQIARKRIESGLLDMQLNLYAVEDGAEDLEVLASVAWYIGLGAQVAAVLDVHSPLTRRLHSALRNVVAMCTAGYRWQAALTPLVDAALSDAKAVLVDNPDTAQPWLPIAEALRQRVLHRAIRADDIAGAELYRDAAPSAATKGSQP